MQKTPSSSTYVVIGGGVHGLSSAYHLALELEASGKGSGADIVVLEKSHIGAGASGIACGVVRNFYFSPPMAEVIRVSVDLFESDPAGFGFHGVGYIAGEPACTEHMQAIFPDWNGEGIEAVLHERQGGWAETQKTVENLARLARSKGVQILEGVEGTGIDLDDGLVQAGETSHVSIDTEFLIVGAGPWGGHIWRMLGLPDEVRVARKERPTSPVGASP